MDEKIQISLHECIVKDNAFKKFYRGNIYKYFTVNASSLIDSTIFFTEIKPLYFVKDSWGGSSYVMFSERMFNETFIKLYEYENKTNEVFDDFKKIISEDNPQIVTEDNEISNDHSFIEANRYR